MDPNNIKLLLNEMTKQVREEISKGFAAHDESLRDFGAEMTCMMQRSSGCEFGSDCFTCGVCKSSACTLFDEMSASEWRDPSRVLEVTVLQVYYPITEMILRQVFAPFGVLQHVHVLGGPNCEMARVVFQSKYDAVEAYGVLHGRNIYDGCCQLIIRYGCPHEPEVVWDTSRSNTTTSLMSVVVETSSAPTSAMEAVTDCGLASAMSLAVDASTGNSNIDTATNCLTECSDRVCGLTAPAMVYASADEVIMDVVHTATELTTSDISTTCICGIVADKPDITWDTGLATIMSLPCPYFILGYMETELGITTPSHEHLLHESVQAYACSQGTNVNISNLGIVPYDVEVHLVLPMKFVEWKSWPPPIASEIKCGSVEIRPIPWPSFNIVDEVTAWWYFGWLKKPPWLLLLLAEMLGSAGPYQWSIEPRKDVVVMFVPWEVPALQQMTTIPVSMLLQVASVQFRISSLAPLEVIEHCCGFICLCHWSLNTYMKLLMKELSRQMGLICTPMKKGGLYSLDVNSLFKYRNTLVDVKVDTKSNISTTLTVLEVLRSTKLVTYVKLPDFNSGKVEVQHFHENGFATPVGMKPSPMVELSGTVGAQGIALGSRHNSGELQIPWDSGGFLILHRLEGKSNFKEGRMLGTASHWDGPSLGLWAALPVREVQEGNSRTHEASNKY